MKKPTVLTIVLVSVAISMALSGCIAEKPPEPEPSSTTLAGSVEMVIENFDNYPDSGDRGAQILTDKVIYDAGGSSSCPPIIEKASIENKTITLSMADYSESICSSDLKYFHQEITLPDSGLLPENSTIEFTVIKGPDSNDLKEPDLEPLN